MRRKPLLETTATRREAITWSIGMAGLVATGCGIAPTIAQEIPAPRADSSPALVSLFPAEVANPKPAKTLKACDAPPPAVTRIASISKYDQTDKTKSTINPAAEAKLRAETAPVVLFTSTVSKLADTVAADPEGSEAHAKCAWQWLEAWARKNALQGPQVDEALRKWELATLSCAVLKLRQYAPASAGGHDEVTAWLHRLGLEVRENYSTGLTRATRRSNHLYWAAYGATTAAIVSNDRSLFDWGINSYRYGVGLIADDGSLPLEMERASRALGYHNFALTALLMIAECGEANGLPLYAARDHSLSRLVRFTLNNMANPSQIEKGAGAAQDMGEAIKPTNLVWLEPWYARTRDPQAERWLREERPLVQKRAGGDLTMLFGAPLPEPAA